MNSILQKYVRQQIGLNIDRPFRIETVQLIAVYEEYFSVSREKDEDLCHIPFANIVRLVENPKGVLVGGMFQQKKSYPLVVKIGHIVDYVPA